MNFSKIGNVSRKPLRCYVDIGSIYPSDINPENAYRYYSIDQLETMLYINHLKSYRFSLDDIKMILDANASDSE